jgi:hypothetical protein
MTMTMTMIITIISIIIIIITNTIIININIIIIIINININIHKPTINQPFTWSFPQTSHGPHLTQHPSPTCSAIRRICRRIRQQQLAQRLGAILSKHRSHAGVT